MKRTRRDEQDVVGLDRPMLCRDGRALDSGSRSRCTPSRLTSPPTFPSPLDRQILSISSRKTMPLSCTAITASCVIWSSSSSLSLSSAISRSDSCPPRSGGASWYRPPKALPSMSLRFIIPIDAPGWPGISNIGNAFALSATLTSISLSFRLVVAEAPAERYRALPAEHFRRPAHPPRVPLRPARRGREPRRSALADQADADFNQIADDAFHIAADIADLGEFRRFDLDERGAGETGRRREISVLPTPVGPIIRMFFGSTSSRSGPSSC
jgi:hypothetical protein